MWIVGLEAAKNSSQAFSVRFSRVRLSMKAVVLTAAVC